VHDQPRRGAEAARGAGRVGRLRGRAVMTSMRETAMANVCAVWASRCCVSRCPGRGLTRTVRGDLRRTPGRRRLC
jgi:hypothetical protein